MLLIFFSCCTGSVFSQNTFQSHNSITSIAEKTIHDSLSQSDIKRHESKSQALDTRLRLKSCTEPLTANKAHQGRTNGSMQTVKVICPATPGWSLYVPVTTRKWEYIVVSSRELFKGDLLSLSSIAKKEVETTNLRDYFSWANSSQILEMEIRRHISSDQEIRSSDLKKQQLMKRGQKISIINNAGSVQIRVSGVALQPGSKGDLISVKNLSSGRKINARIIDRNTVSIR